MRYRILFKLSYAFLGLICLFSIVFPANADALWSPRSQNQFLDDHWMETELGQPRYYLAEGPNGEVSLHISPESPRIIAKFPNGTPFLGSYQYLDTKGDEWLIVEADTNGTFTSGWVKTDELKVVYDAISFYEENESRLIPYEGQVNPETIYDFVFWEYPGSSKINETWLDRKYPLKHQDIDVPYAYIDPDGNIWSYYEIMGGKYAKGWVFYDDPYRTEPIAIRKQAPTTSDMMFNNSVPSNQVGESAEQPGSAEELTPTNFWEILDIQVDQADPTKPLLNRYSNLSCISTDELGVTCVRGTGHTLETILLAEQYFLLDFSDQSGYYNALSYVEDFSSSSSMNFSVQYLKYINDYQQNQGFFDSEIEGIDQTTLEADYLTILQKDDKYCTFVADVPTATETGVISIICIRE